MKIIALFCLLLVAADVHADKPNVMVILVDDMGFSDLGCYGGEIETPNLDSLAKGGLRFSQFYNTARCWPTRAAILTGYYAQQVRRDRVAGVPSGGRGKRPAWAPLLPALLKPLGYRSYHSGKWHVDGMPIAGGFDRSYYLRDQGRFFNPNVHWKDDKRLPPVKKGTGYYGTTAIAEHAIECLKEHAKSHAKKPFFHYLAFTAPHFPLHALPKDIDKYRKRYRAGWESVREDRWKRIRQLGFVSGKLSPVEKNIGPPYHFPQALKTLGEGEVNRPIRWEKLTAAQREFQADKMAIHAAMVDRIDQEVGRVIAQLKRMRAFENTLIMFLSDNGASAEIMVRADGHDPKAARGSAASYLCLGPGWSTACNTPFRRHKTWVHEGGCATSFLAHWPRGITSKGAWRKTPAHAIDLVPTILELAGGKLPGSWNGRAVPKKPGRSLVPAFSKNVVIERDFLWWSHEGHRALRMGNWKIVAAKGDRWELYDLSRDRTETNNLAKRETVRLKKMAAIWEARNRDFTRLAGGKVKDGK